MTRVAVVLIFAVAAVACTRTSPPPESAQIAQAALVERARVSMGSELRLTAWSANEAATVATFEAVFAEFERLDGLMSVWREGSEILRLNAAAGDHAVPVGDEVRETLQLAQTIGDWTDGKFDVTFAALSDLWKFDHDQDDRIPRPRDVAARLPLIDYRALRIDPAAKTAFLARRGMKAHLGGIGKGYAIDRAVSILRSRDVADFMIQSGGDLYVSGRHGDRPWRIGIRDPRGPVESSFAAVDLADGAVSTSGDYERFFIQDGRRYHHILDPDDGAPASGSRSVTIVAGRSAIADGLATGVFVMGPDEGMRLIERLPGVEGVIVTARNNVLVSSGLRGRLEVRTAPTDAP